MKTWWPWHKNKPLSLFEKNPPECSPDLSNAGGPRQKVIPHLPHPKNAPGGFYVVDTECMSCGYPHVLAPELMDWETDPEGHPQHCFFRKQPETALEVIHAVKAVEGSCCGALRYCGDEAEIIRKLKDARCKDAIDRR